MTQGSDNSRGLGEIAVGGAFWITLGRWSVRLANILMILVLARLVSVEEYGVVALMMLLLNILEIPALGLQGAVIQRDEEPTQRHLNVAWTYDKFAINLVGSALIFLGAPLIAGFFDQLQTVNMVRAVALMPLLQILENNALIVMTRQLQYRRRAWFEASNGVTCALVVVPLAFWWQSAWAVVVAFLCGQFGRVIASYVIYPHVPRVRFDRDIFAELFPFGRWLIGQQLVRKIKGRADELVLGSVLGTTSLGIFQVGSRFSSRLISDLHSTVGKVLFPIYSKMQHQPDQIARRYELILQALLFIALPAGAGIILVADSLIVVAVGDKWLVAVPAMQVLAIAGVLKVVVGSSFPLFRGMGKPNLEFFLLCIEGASLVVLIAVLSNYYGYVGAAWGVLLAQVLVVPALLWMLWRALGISGVRLVVASLPPLAVTAAMGTILWLTGGLLDLQPAAVDLAIMVFVGIASYSVMCVAGWRLFGWRAGNFAANIIQKLLSRLRKRSASTGDDTSELE